MSDLQLFADDEFKRADDRDYRPAVARNQMPDFDGATYERERDHIRLAKQGFAVWSILLDREWHTLRELARATGYPEASISARIRDLRKPKFGGHTVEHECLGAGTWRYRLIKQGAPVRAK